MTEFSYLLEAISRSVQRDGYTKVAASVAGAQFRARDLADELDLHCCYWHREGLYQFQKAEVPKPVTKEEKRLWEVIR